MKVFISWSGSRSKKVAEVLKTWIPLLIQAVDPWISVDIDKGRRWDAEISEQLEQSRIGIICVTRDNLNANWLHFEAGALSKTKDAFVCTLLLDVKPSDVQPPLGLFQHTHVQQEDFYKLLQTINVAVGNEGERSPSEATLRSLFDKLWPELETSLTAVAKQPERPTTPVRTDSELIQEVLEILRTQERRAFTEMNTESESLQDAPKGIVGRRIRDLDELKELWPNVLMRIRNKIGVTAVAYLHDARPVEMKDGIVTLSYSKEFHWEKASAAMDRLNFEKVFNECLDSPHKWVFVWRPG